MSRRLFIPFLLLLAGLATSAPVLAAEVDGGNIGVTASVAPARYIYIDKSGNITKVASNTSAQVAPHVIGEIAQSAISSKIASQYAAVLSDNGGNLADGFYYPSNKVAIAQLAHWIIYNPYFSYKFY